LTGSGQQFPVHPQQAFFARSQLCEMAADSRNKLARPLVEMLRSSRHMLKAEPIRGFDPYPEDFP